MSITNGDEGYRSRSRRGEVDDIHFPLSRRAASAWTQYLLTAAEVNPDVISSLLTPDALTLSLRFSEERMSIDGHISEWCERWGFIEHFARTPALNTLVDAGTEGSPLPTTFVCDVHGNRFDRPAIMFTRSRTFDGTTTREDVPGAVLTGDIPIFHWDPRREAKSSALGRIMDAIETIIRADLESIEAAYLGNGYERLREKRQPDHFVWLARFQLCRETVADIAEDIKPDQDPEHRERTIRRGILSVCQDLNIKPRRDRSGPKPRIPDSRQSDSPNVFVMTFWRS